MKIHLLDMGQTKYGDCIVITHNDRSILIDGAHPGDAASIRYQLSKIFKHQPPFDFDLLVVTHCHGDHIGCLPELVSLGDITAKQALISDEYLGFGLARNEDNAKFIGSASDATKSLFVAMQEEDHSGMPESDIEQFLFDAARLVDKYTGMIGELEEAGTKIQRYPGEDWKWVEKLQKDFKDFGLKILGPTSEHLIICAEAIAAAAGSDAIKYAAADAELDYAKLAQTYKSAVQALYPKSDDPTADRPGVGAAKNNQSIVLSFEADGWKALLAGDMQFGKAEVGGLGKIMNKLVNSINAAGPYNFIKLSHHSSYNGINENILAEWLKGTTCFAHTGGVRDPAHPEPSVLELLKGYSRELKLARTDRNGIITVSKKGGEVQMDISKGRLNDFTHNRDIDAVELPAEAPKAAPAPAAPAPVVIQQAEAAPGGVVKINAEIPHTTTKVVITVEVEPQKKKTDPVVAAPVSPNPDSRSRLSNLLFISSFQRLIENIGQPMFDTISGFIRGFSGSELIDLGASLNPDELSQVSLNKLKSGVFKGVVILGGYEVVPAQRLMAIDPQLMQELVAIGKEDYDADGFVIWSDDIYGDADGDKLPNYPVSRIPDSGDGGFLLGSLQVPAFSTGNRFGVRNFNRAYAQRCFDLIPGSNQLEVSEVFSPDSNVAPANQCAVYFMLHGSEIDGTRFWGEKRDRRFYQALDIKAIPHANPGNIVFTGACWGALISDVPAYRVAQGSPLISRTPANSIAMAYLKNGVQAYVGCTGSHYSPVKPPWDTYGKPMHDEFWNGIANNLPPARALFEAKKKYILEMPHTLSAAIERAAELKTVRQFTCLGLGW